MDALLDRVLCRAESEVAAYEAYLKHVRGCRQCNFGSRMCDRGVALFRRWQKAQAAQEPA